MFENVLAYCRQVKQCSSSLEEGLSVVMLVISGTLWLMSSTSRKFNNHDFSVLLDEFSVVNGKKLSLTKVPYKYT